MKYKNTLDDFNIPCYLHINPVEDTYLGVNQLIHNYGFGPLKPNTIIRGLNENYYQTDLFCNMLIDINVIGKNLVLLKDSDEINFDKAEPKKIKQINLWWNQENKKSFELSLALAHVMKNSKIWTNANICIKTIVESEEKRERVLNVLRKLNKRMRIKNLNFAPLVDPSQDFVTNLTKFSSDASLTFIGLKHYDPKRSFLEYKNYYLNLFEGLKNVKNIAYVLSGENLNFEKIFT